MARHLGTGAATAELQSLPLMQPRPSQVLRRVQECEAAELAARGLEKVPAGMSETDRFVHWCRHYLAGPALSGAPGDA